MIHAFTIPDDCYRYDAQVSIDNMIKHKVNTVRYWEFNRLQGSFEMIEWLYSGFLVIVILVFWAGVVIGRKIQ